MIPSNEAHAASYAVQGLIGRMLADGRGDASMTIHGVLHAVGVILGSMNANGLDGKPVSFDDHMANAKVFIKAGFDQAQAAKSGIIKP